MFGQAVSAATTSEAAASVCQAGEHLHHHQKEPSDELPVPIKDETHNLPRLGRPPLQLVLPRLHQDAVNHPYPCQDLPLAIRGCSAHGPISK